MPRATDFTSRVRFNWGYHDGASDVMKGYSIRRLTEKGPQTLETVSLEYSAAYARGYMAGVADAQANTYTGNSERAWEVAVVTYPELEQQ